MRAWRAVNQLKSELAQVEAAMADSHLADCDNPNWVDGYWNGRYHGLREAIYLTESVRDHKEHDD